MDKVFRQSSEEKFATQIFDLWNLFWCRPVEVTIKNLSKIWFSLQCFWDD